jgi:Xaa-Pro aminopeptidase
VDHELRRRSLADRLHDVGVDALLITTLPNVRYLTGFTGSNAQVIVRPAGALFFTDGRYTEQARREVPDVERTTYPSGFGAVLGSRLADQGIDRLGVEAGNVTLAFHRKLSEHLAGIELVETDEVVERMRWSKDPDELRALNEAQAATDLAFDDLLDVIAVGMSERELADKLERLLRRDGADGLAFDSIVAFGESAAEPHHEPGDRRLEEGDVIKLDFGAIWGGYHADMTRTIAFGSPATELKKIHDIVRQAQQAGIDAVRPGIPGGDVDAAARRVIEDAGYGDRFGHGTGHGVGLEIHEGPRVGHDVADELPVGAVVTVEPGIYVPALGGVRIEDMVEITEDGGRVLGTSPRELIEL